MIIANCCYGFSITNSVRYLWPLCGQWRKMSWCHHRFLQPSLQRQPLWSCFTGGPGITAVLQRAWSSYLQGWSCRTPRCIENSERQDNGCTISSKQHLLQILHPQPYTKWYWLYNTFRATRIWLYPSKMMFHYWRIDPEKSRTIQHWRNETDSSDISRVSD